MLEITDFNKRHRTASLKAQYINFDTSLKLTKLQMDDRAFKDGLMDHFYELVRLHLVRYAHHFTFRELVYPLIIKFLLEKVQENFNLIEERRQKTGLNDNWLEQSRQQSTSSPLVVHFERYKSLREREAFLRQISTLDRTFLPDLIRPERQVAGKENFKSMIEKEFSDNEDEEEELFQITAKRKYDDIDDDQEEEEKEEIEEDDDNEDKEEEEEDISTSPPVKIRQAKMNNGDSSIPTTDGFLSIVKKKFDR